MTATPDDEKQRRLKARNTFESIALGLPIVQETPAASNTPVQPPMPARPKPGPNDNPFPDMPLPALLEQPLN